MKEIDVKVCLGTACFTKGSLTMNELLEIVPHKYGKSVKLSVSNCLGVCSINWEQSKAPYVKVNNEIIFAHLDKVLQIGEQIFVSINRDNLLCFDSNEKKI